MNKQRETTPPREVNWPPSPKLHPRNKLTHLANCVSPSSILYTTGQDRLHPSGNWIGNYGSGTASNSTALAIYRQVRPGWVIYSNLLAIPFFLQHVKVLAVLELAVLFTEQPGQHLSGLHASPHNASGFIPVSASFAATVTRTILRVPLYVLQAYLVQNSYQQVVHVMIDPDRDLDELHTIGARHALAICEQHAPD